MQQPSCLTGRGREGFGIGGAGDAVQDSGQRWFTTPAEEKGRGPEDRGALGVGSAGVRGGDEPTGLRFQVGLVRPFVP